MVELTTLSSRSSRATAPFLNCCISHGSAMRFFKRWQEVVIYFVDNLLLFPTVKEFSKSANGWWSYCKNSTPRYFFETQCI